MTDSTLISNSASTNTALKGDPEGELPTGGQAQPASSGKSPVVLIIEDEDQICRALKITLQDAGYNVYIANTLKQGEIEAATRKPDIIIVDLGLPDGDGVMLIQSVRNYSATPIIVLSARISEESKVAALDAGADDYLTKPFGVSELMARIRAQLRRRAIPPDKEDQKVIRLGSVTIDLVKQIVTRDGVPVHLTKLEMRLLTVLLAERGKVLTQRYLMQQVWGAGYVEHSHYLRIYMAHLRQKLEDDPTSPKYFLTETGVGYRLAI